MLVTQTGGGRFGLIDFCGREAHNIVVNSVFGGRWASVRS